MSPNITIEQCAQFQRKTTTLMTSLFNIALEKILVYATLNIKPALVAATNVFSWLTVPQQSIRESRVYHNVWAVGSAQIDWPVTTVASATPRTVQHFNFNFLCTAYCFTGRLASTPLVTPSLSQAQSISTSIQNRGQYHRNTWKDAANINESGIRMQNSTVPITGTNMATLRSNNLASNECFVFILEPFVGTKPCTYLSTFEVIREGTIKFCVMDGVGTGSLNTCDRGLKPIPEHSTTALRYRVEARLGLTGVKMEKYLDSWYQANASPLRIGVAPAADRNIRGNWRWLVCNRLNRA
ncbi:hypothetical protein B0H14DRAFT_2621895 [Mycena olivaceomarginata]|nr:hypothetical protein B0H14DRAFT_2621895 [Mycena olivaceomarginata]